MVDVLPTPGTGGGGSGGGSILRYQMPAEVVELGRKYRLTDAIVQSSSSSSDDQGSTLSQDAAYATAAHQESNYENALQKHVSDLKRLIRSAMAKEMRIKEGYENLRRATRDKKQLEKLKLDLRSINERIDEMQYDLQTLDIYATGTIVPLGKLYFPVLEPWEPLATVSILERH